MATKVYFDTDLFLTNLANLEGETKDNEQVQSRITAMIELVTSEREFTTEDMADIQIEDIDEALAAVGAMHSNDYDEDNLGAKFVCNMIDVQRGKDNLRSMKIKQVAQSTDFF